MEAIKQVPVGSNVYYKCMIDTYTQKKKEALILLEDLESSIKPLYEEVKSNKDTYKTQFNLDLFKYEEFVNNEYVSGEFFKVAKGAFINRKNNYTLVADLFSLFCLAKKQREIYDIKKDIELYENLINTDNKTYKKILRLFYTEVHKQLIIKGKGYAFEGSLGWICINRCKIERKRPSLDYTATRKRKAEIIAEGKRPYSSEEAEWCKKNNIPYDGVPYRIFQKLEYMYEIPLIDCKLPDGRKYKLVMSDTRGKVARGKTNDELIADAKGDLNYICDLQLGLNAKLSICLKMDKTLYTNFIRNENQKPVNAIKIDRKD